MTMIQNKDLNLINKGLVTLEKDFYSLWASQFVYTGYGIKPNMLYDFGRSGNPSVIKTKRAPIKDGCEKYRFHYKGQVCLIVVDYDHNEFGIG